MRAAINSLLLLSCWTLFTTQLVAQEEKGTPPKADSSLRLKSEKEIVYGKGGDVELKLDLTMPATGDGPFPAVVCIHGGGWQAGNRQSNAPLMTVLAQHGYATVTISYRFAPQYKYPAQIHDAKAAVRWLRANAKKYKVDPDHIGAIGFSAGGHLSSLLGTTDKNDGLEGDGGNAEQSSRVQAVVNFFGPTDFTKKDWDQATEDKFFIPTLGEKFVNKPDLYKRFSPASYATKDDAPTLFQHGDQDKLVGVRHSRDMAEQLKGLGIDSRAEIIAGAGHGWGGADMIKSIQQSVEFFDKHLKPKAISTP